MLLFIYQNGVHEDRNQIEIKMCMVERVGRFEHDSVRAGIRCMSIQNETEKKDAINKKRPVALM